MRRTARVPVLALPAVLAAVLGSGPLAPQARAQTLEFRGAGQAARHTLDEMKARAQPQNVTVLEPHEAAQRQYLALPAQAVLDAAFGEAWKQSREVLFECSDGYKAAVPSSKLQRYRAYLAFGKPEGDFTLRNRVQNDELVKLGPFYLVWDNLAAPELQAEGGEDWPYQIVAIELVDPAKAFARMEPPAGASDSARRGFAAFREHCQACHSINGEGGGKSVELNFPASVTEYYREEWIRRWIAEPTSVRYNTTMPALNPELPGRDAVIEDLVSYLEAMAGHKQKPADFQE